MQFNVLKITGKLRDMPDNFVTYSLSTNIIQYIGVCKFGDLMYTPDARSNTLYHACFPIDAVATLEILHINNHRPNCVNEALRLISKYQPTMNVYGRVHNENTAPIICRETGEVFNAMEDAARVHKINVGALCQHLKNAPGYKTIKGRTYYRGDAIVVGGELRSKLPLAESQIISKKIKNITTGQIFDSITSVAKHYNVTTVAVSRHLKGQSKTLKGNIFTRV